jgi:hypothetical protein
MYTFWENTSILGSSNCTRDMTETLFSKTMVLDAILADMRLGGRRLIKSEGFTRRIGKDQS